MIYTIPVKPVPSQQVVCEVGGKQVTVLLRQMGGRQYFSASAQGNILCRSVLITDRTYLIRAPYLGFSGDFLSVDTQGEDIPAFTGWGTRFLMCYDDGK